jgi:hypothetical protein
VDLTELDGDREALWPLIQDVPQIWFPGKDSKPRAGAAQLRAAQEHHESAAAKAERDRDRLIVFNLANRCWLLESRAGSGPSDVVLEFDTSAFRKHVAGAPLRLRVHLRDGRTSLRSPGGVAPLNGPLDKYMVMGTALEGDTVVLKPHRKERGQVLVEFSGYSLSDESGKALEVPTLQEQVARYWRQAFNV